jgi:MFS family permease
MYGGEEMDINAIADRAKNVLLKPKETLEAAKEERPSMQDLVIYLALVALPTLIGIIIGYGIFGFGVFYTSLRVPIGLAVAWGIMQYVLLIIGVLVFGYIVNLLAPSFSSKQDLIQATKLVVYAATPGLAAGILYILPPLSILVFLASLYGLYILYVGIPVLMETPEDKQFTYLIISIIVYIIIWWLVMAIVGWITGAVMWGMMGPRSGFHM